MATKSILKSIRISDEVFGYIDQSPGKGFNEKFENIILQAKQDEPKRLKRLAELDKSISKKRSELQRLFEKYDCMDEFFRSVLKMQHQLYDMKELLE